MRYNLANRGYPSMLIISAHLETEVTKIKRMMQTSEEGNRSVGREA